MRMKKFKHCLFLIFTAVAILSLVACSNDNGNAVDNNKSADDVVELEFWRAEDVGRADFKVFMEVVEAFQEEHPEINLKVDTTVHADYRTRLNTQAAGGQLPDVFQVWPGAELEPLVEGGVLQPINDFTDYWTEETGLLNEEDFDDFSIDGDVYAVPANTNPTHFIYYDKDILADVGHDSFPGSYDEFLQLIDDLNADDITPIALGNSDGCVLQSVYISTIADRFTGPDFLGKVLSGEKKFTEPEFVEALGVIEELVEKEAFNGDFNTVDSTQMIDYFLQGKAAMVMDGNWGLASILENMPEDKNIGIAYIPLGDSNSISTIAGTGMALNSELSGEKREAAETFLKYIYNEDLWQKLTSVGRPVLANIDMPEGEELDPLTAEMIQLASESTPAPVYDGTLPTDVNSVLENELQSITVGGSTPEEAAENIQKAVESK